MFNLLYLKCLHNTSMGITMEGVKTGIRSIHSFTAHYKFGIFSSVSVPFTNPVRYTKRGVDFQPNTFKRIKKHGWQTRMKTTDGKITIMRRMMRGISRRKLTH